METYSFIHAVTSNAQMLAKCGDSGEITALTVFICLYIMLALMYGLFQAHEILDDSQLGFKWKEEYEQARIVAWSLIRIVVWPLLLFRWLRKWTYVLIRGKSCY